MKAQDSRVPAEVEAYFIEIFARAGQMGGSIGGGLGGGRGGARGGARGAARLKTLVEERSGTVPGDPEEVAARLTAAFPRAKRLPAAERLRLAVPVGLTGLQQIVVDLELVELDVGSTSATLWGFGKEGLISRHPTLKVTDQAWSAIQAGQASPAGT
jgi:hypothetical protein